VYIAKITSFENETDPQKLFITAVNHGDC